MIILREKKKWVNMVERSVGAQLPMLMFSCLQLLLLQWFFPFTASREGWLALLRGIA